MKLNFRTCGFSMINFLKVFLSQTHVKNEENSINLDYQNLSISLFLTKLIMFSHHVLCGLKSR